LSRMHNLINALNLMSSEKPEEIENGLKWFTDNFNLLEGDHYRQAMQAVASVFTYDTYEKPEFQGLITTAINLLANQGELCIPYLLELLRDSDYKVEFNLAIVLGKIGGAAVEPLIDAFKSSHHPAERAFIIYALGKIKDKEVAKAGRMMLDALNDPDREVRDSAARSWGKITEWVTPDMIAPEERAKIFESLLPKTRDEFSGVRSKAIRSLGRFALKGFLTEDQKHELQTALVDILGKSGDFIWDSAFIVRREAEAVYKQLTGNEE
jgi:HEAT repeat protein